MPAASPVGPSNPVGTVKSTILTFPLSDVDHPVAIVELDGRPLRLVVNTGVPATVIDARYRALLGEATPHASGSKAYATHAHPRATIGGTQLALAEVVSLDLGESVVGEGVDGFLGMDVLRRFCVDFDWDDGLLILSSVGPELPGVRHVQVPLTYSREHVPQVAARLDGQPIELAVDTGWIGPLTLAPADEKRVFPKGAAKSVSEFGMTPRGILESRMTRASDLQLGDAHVQDVLCSVQLPTQTTSKIGAYLLREQRAILDFPHDRLLFVRREHSTTAEADMSGIHLLRRRGKTLVYAVDGDSAAASAKVAAGDQIVAVDDEPAAGLTPAQIRELLRSGDGERLTLKIVHQGSPRTVELTLRKRI